MSTQERLDAVDFSPPQPPVRANRCLTIAVVGGIRKNEGVTAAYMYDVAKPRLSIAGALAARSSLQGVELRFSSQHPGVITPFGLPIQQSVTLSVEDR